MSCLHFSTLTSLSQQLTAATLQNLAAIPEVNTILQQLSVYMKVVMARLNQSSCKFKFIFYDSLNSAIVRYMYMKQLFS